jgi:peptidoglycan/xylan/chitin deacetylase (PgdA/CDA1 family)
MLIPAETKCQSERVVSMARLRGIVKSLVEKAICASGAPARARSAHLDDTLILCYHNIVPSGCTAAGDPSLHLPQRAFAGHLDYLARFYHVVPLARAFDADTGGRPRVVITFDDACAGALTAGTAELVERGLTGTFFVTPGMIGAGPYWWDAIRDTAGRALDGEDRDFVLEKLGGRNEAAREWAASKGYTMAEVPSHQLAGSESLLASACDRGMTLASHTWSHPNLVALPEAERQTELSAPKQWLEARFPGTLPWLAYPYGLYSPEVEKAAAEAGYLGALRVEGGWARGGPEPLRVPRENIGSGLSLRGFQIRVSGARLPGMT